MNRVMLAFRSLRFYWRAHMGVLLGATLATAILVGALAVGDSVRESLRQLALSRLGSVQFVLNSQSRFFRTALADSISTVVSARVAPVILLRGTAANGDYRAGRIQVLGVDTRFWSLGPSLHPAPNTLPATQESVVLNDRLAGVLGVKVGEEVLLRVDKPSLLSRDAPLSTVTDSAVNLRIPVAAIVTDDGFGRFSLDANQIPPLNAYLPIEFLQRKIGLEGRANLLLIGARKDKPLTSAEATAALWNRWEFSDAGLEIRELPATGSAANSSGDVKQPFLELRTDRVFLDPFVGHAATVADPSAHGVLTYFVNELRVGERSTPYSTVAALRTDLVPKDMKPDEVLINSWLAEDLHAKPGDSLALKYWIVGPMRQLIEQTASFRIRAVLPLSGAANDPDLMPPIPGLADKKDCRDWEPGVPIDLKKIRDKDQKYWSLYKGTPKAFITLEAGQKIWNNRFGDLTAVRFPLAGASRTAIESRLKQAINPASLGLFFIPARDQALAASSPSFDFGQLFLGFSLFLIVAAILLTGLLFALGVEQRAEEVGILLAVGWTPGRVQRQLLVEGGLLALMAGIAGAGLAVFYTRATVYGLSTVWRGAVGNSVLQYHAEPATLVAGALSGILVALLAIWLVTRKQARGSARELLAGGAESESRLLAADSPVRQGSRPVQSRQRTKTGKGRRSVSLPLAVGAIGSALILVVAALSGGREHGAAYFFGAGALLLTGGLAACLALLTRMARGSSERLSIGILGVRNSARRMGRSLSAIGLLACGSFLVIAVGANRLDSHDGADKRSSGTGGFALYGETTLPVFQDMNTEEGREAFGLDAADLRDVRIVAMRLRQGDEASCLNLNRAVVPSLLGVQPEAFHSRGSFTFAQTMPNPNAARDPWSLLSQPSDDGTIPVIGDANTVEWSLGKSLGATLPYLDDRGNTLKLKIVGILANSVLQGHLIVSEENLVRHFPAQSGYQVFLMDVPKGKEAAVRKTMVRALEDVGMDVTSTTDRLAAFNAVENTYLSIFAMLGGLGLLLGSFGLGVVVLRNVLERRSELALLCAVGLRVSTVHWLVFSEHALLLSLGLIVGTLSALVAVLPALRTPGAEVPFLSLALTLGAVLASGFLWTWGATSLALRGPLLSVLRND